MQIYQCAKVSSLFSRVNKLSRKLVCKVDVIATASPLPSLVGYAFVSVITPASRKFAITTSSRNGVRNTGGCNRVGESCFSASWKTEKCSVTQLNQIEKVHGKRRKDEKNTTGFDLNGHSLTFKLLEVWFTRKWGALSTAKQQIKVLLVALVSTVTLDFSDSL